MSLVPHGDRFEETYDTILSRPDTMCKRKFERSLERPVDFKRVSAWPRTC